MFPIYLSNLVAQDFRISALVLPVSVKTVPSFAHFAARNISFAIA
jgi:hypothetical protein